MNFDTDGLGDYVQRLHFLIDAGFGEPEIAQLMSTVRAMEHNEERSLDFPICGRASRHRCSSGVFMDDIDSPDVGSVAVPDLAARIDEDLRAWAEARRL